MNVGAVKESHVPHTPEEILEALVEFGWLRPHSDQALAAVAPAFNSLNWPDFRVDAKAQHLSDASADWAAHSVAAAAVSPA
jgi:hypothetical protein